MPKGWFAQLCFDSVDGYFAVGYLVEEDIGNRCADKLSRNTIVTANSQDVIFKKYFFCSDIVSGIDRYCGVVDIVKNGIVLRDGNHC